MAAGDHHHRAVLEVAIVEHDADRGEIVIGVRIKRPVLVPLDRRAITGRFHVELAGVEAHRAPQILQHLDDLRMPRRPGVFGVVQLRRLDPPHPRLGGRMRIFEVVDLVVGRDMRGVAHELVGDPAQRFDFLRRQDFGKHDEPVAAIDVDLGLRQHGSSIGSGSAAIAEPRGRSLSTRRGLASATGRSKSWLINEALRCYVANEQQFPAAVEEGKQALREGKIVDHETVVAAFERIVKPQP